MEQEQQFQYDQNEPPIIQEEYQASKKSSLSFFVIGGGVIVLALFAGIFFMFSKGDLNVDKFSTAGFSCPINRIVLQACSYELQARENSEIQIPPEVEELTRGITCPQTKEQLESCLTGKINPAKPSTVDLQVKINGAGPFDVTQDVSLGDEVTLVWDSTNSNFCTLNGSQMNPTGTLLWFNGQLKAGEEVTQEIRCGDATDSITLNVGPYKLTDFQRATNRWINRFDTSNIPTDSYRAYYFNSLEPTKVKKTEIVPKVAINYVWSDGPGFQNDSMNFGGFWVGKINIETPGVYSVVTTQSWSEERVIIDGFEIPSGTETKIELEKGEYQVEVEYLNNSHTVDFLFALEPTKTKYNLQELKDVVSVDDNVYDVWYVYGYNEGHILNITQAAKRPTIIFLESYEPTQWQINNAKANNIAYIVYASYKPGANVKSDLDNKRILLVDRDAIPDPNSAGSAGVEAHCWTDNYPPRCDNVYTISNLDRFAKEFSGGSLTGFTALTDSDENLVSVTIPRVTLNASKIAEILAKNEKIKAEAEAQAKKEAGASVETLFSN